MVIWYQNDPTLCTDSKSDDFMRKKLNIPLSANQAFFKWKETVVSGRANKSLQPLKSLAMGMLHHLIHQGILLRRQGFVRMNQDRLRHWYLS
jgi:hypothetical protein